MGDADYITLARIGRSRGVQGEFYAWPLAEDMERFSRLSAVYLVREKKRESHTVETAEVISGKLILKVNGIDSPEQVRFWTNGFVEIDADKRVELPDGKYFHDDIVGLKVLTEEETKIGVIEKVLEMPAHDVYVCRTITGQEALIPAIEGVILRVDLTGGMMIINPIPGLFD